MKRYSWILVMTVIFVSFQNCAPQKGIDSESSSTLTSDTQFNKSSAEEFRFLSLWDSGCDEACSHQQVTQSVPRFLEIDVTSGLMVSVPLDSSLPQQKFCVADEKMTELSAILSGAEVCAPVIPEGFYEGQVCAMVYRHPYAVLKVNQSEIVQLGEKTSSCDIPTDLCGDKAAQLRSWKDFIVSHMEDTQVVQAANDQGSCPP